MAELVDAADLKSVGLMPVRVRLPPVTFMKNTQPTVKQLLRRQTAATIALAIALFTLAFMIFLCILKQPKTIETTVDPMSFQSKRPGAAWVNGKRIW